MAASSPAPGTDKTNRPNTLRRVVAASLAGTTLEWYDHYLYGAAAALVFPRLFFPAQDPFAATMLSLATYAVAFLTRPLGAALFGHLGDRHGRRSTLVTTLLLMGTATALIGLLPTYPQVGVAAPAMLALLRFVQGIGLGGEWGGAALMVGEHDTRGRRRGFSGALVQVASPLGLLLANGVFSLVTFLVSDEAFFAWGWRVPFLLSTVLIIVGLWVRVRVQESPLFAERDAEPEPRTPLREVLTRHWRHVALAVGSRVGSDVTFYIFFILLLVYGTRIGHDRQLLLNAVLLAAASQVVSIPLWGALTDRIGRRPVLIIGALGTGVWVFAFFTLLHSSSAALVVLAVVVGSVFHAAMWGPLAAFVPELFPTRVRYTGAGIGFQTAGVFGGALAPIICALLIAHFGSWVPVALYLIAMLAILVLCVLAAGETSRVDLRTVGSRAEVEAPSGAAPRETEATR